MQDYFGCMKGEKEYYARLFEYLKTTKRIICKTVKIYEQDNENTMLSCLDI